MQHVFYLKSRLFPPCCNKMSTVQQAQQSLSFRFLKALRLSQPQNNCFQFFSKTKLFDAQLIPKQIKNEFRLSVTMY
jgi:hypothetical protein